MEGLSGITGVFGVWIGYPNPDSEENPAATQGVEEEEEEERGNEYEDGGSVVVGNWAGKEDRFLLDCLTELLPVEIEV